MRSSAGPERPLADAMALSRLCQRQLLSLLSPCPLHGRLQTAACPLPDALSCTWRGAPSPASASLSLQPLPGSSGGYNAKYKCKYKTWGCKTITVVALTAKGTRYSPSQASSWLGRRFQGTRAPGGLTKHLYSMYGDPRHGR